MDIASYWQRWTRWSDNFRENKDKIHVMLLDVVMPKLNGIDLFKEIKKSEPNTKVLFMSGHKDILGRNIHQDKIKCISKHLRLKHF